MDKLWLIIKREYLTRVKKRSFILATILTPLAFGLFFIVVGYIFSYEGDDAKRVAVLDESGMLDNILPNDKNLIFKFVKDPLPTLKNTYAEDGFDGILVIPRMYKLSSKNHTIFYYSDNDPISIDIELSIKNKIGKRIKKYKVEAFGIDEKELANLETSIKLDPEPINEGAEDVSSNASYIAAAIGGGMGMIMYMTVFIYGMMVMRSVMEEKTSRIVEVMISSVKPFQLMMGKIIGVGAVGLTQMGIWMILIPTIIIFVNLIFGFDPSNMDTTSLAGGVDMEEKEMMVRQFIEEFWLLNWWLILPLFIFYFLGGYFLYASMFAAVGSAMGDDMGEGQALTIPITIPVVLALYIMIVVIRTPQSTLAIWSSIFPLFSPIVMPARLAFHPPVWQIITSMIVLALSAVFFVWLSGRIYRVGILMYGKKVTFKELAKWMFSKE